MDSLLELPTIKPLAGPPLIDAMLAEQQSLTAVARFARLHEAGETDAKAKYYRDLIPLGAPGPGEQYAFSVDLDACSGCKACVTACHSLNGLDDAETFRDVGALVGRDSRGLHVQQHVTTACHHCLEPACLTGCPTRAYDKDPVTGIVRHLDDQCIGCQYCTLMCPYDVPKYNPAKGIVRKCDMCRQRLSDGEAPACVQACPNQAIRIELVRNAQVQQQAREHQFLAHASDPALTIPATRFHTQRLLRDLQPTNEHHSPQHSHLPLVLMLVLTQMSIGMLIVCEGLRWVGHSTLVTFFAGVTIGLVGLVAAVFHLGRPQIAHRAWLGWRTSWMSREIIAFHLWLAPVAAVALFETGLMPRLVPPSLETWFGSAAAAAGIVAILCSAMIYVATRRAFWSARRTLPRFLITAALLGASGALAVQCLQNDPAPGSLVAILLAAAIVRVFVDAQGIRQLQSAITSPLTQAFELLQGPLSTWNHLQAAAAMVGGILLPMLMAIVPAFAPALVLPSLVLLLAAELIQRGLFFAACVSPGMPGVHHA